MASERERRFVGPRRGQLIFALAFFAVSVLLLSLITEQTRWIAKSRLAAQPRFWPAVGLGGMVVMGGLHLWYLPWRRVTRFDTAEMRKWAGVVEYALWFLAYVALVPMIGYLPVTVVFVALLAWRMGYRDARMIWIGIGFSIAVVVVFKSFLSVKIPGGALYEYLPGAWRSFFILNF